MATSTRTNLSFLVDEIVSAVAYNEFELEPMLMPAIYNMRPAGMGRRERFASISGLGQFQTKNEAQNSSQDNVIQQFEKDFVHDSFGLHTEVSRELIDDNEFGFFQQLGEEIGMSAARTMETKAADVLDDAFAGATYTAEDGLSLCNSAHVNVDSGNSQDNSGTTALSAAAVDTTRTAMRNFTDYRGERISVMPDGLIVPNALETTAWEIVRSSLKPDTTNNNANMFNGMFELFVWDYLDDANNWFMIDKRLAKRHLLWLQRTALEIYGDGDLKKGTRTIGGYYRESHGPKDWRFIYGHNVT